MQAGGGTGGGQDHWHGDRAQGGWQGGSPYGPPSYGQPAFGQPVHDQPGYGPSGPEQSGYDQSGYGRTVAPPYGPSGARPGPARGRPGWILLTSFLVQLVVVAAVGNQAVAKQFVKFAGRHSLNDSVLPRTALFYQWRFSPASSDHARLFQSQLFGLLALFVVSALLTLTLVRGSITFGRAFFAVLLSTLGGAVADGMVQRAVFRFDTGFPGNKAVQSIFGGSGFDVVAGLLLGVIAGLIAALVALVTRRPAVPMPVYVAPPQPEREPEAPPPWFGDEERDPVSAQTLSLQKVQDSVGRSAPPAPQPSPPPSRGGYGTQELPAVTSGAGGPSGGPSAGGQADRPSAGGPSSGGLPPGAVPPNMVPPRRDDARDAGDRRDVGDRQNAGDRRDADPTQDSGGYSTPTATPTANPTADPGADPRPARDQSPDATSVLPRITNDDATTRIPQRLSMPGEVSPAPSPGQPGGSDQARTTEPGRSESGSGQSGQSGQSQPGAGDATTQFPRPPDDEDLGHQPD